MQYRGKSIEIIGTSQMFDKTFCWIHILEDDEFKQVMAEEESGNSCVILPIIT